MLRKWAKELESDTTYEEEIKEDDPPVPELEAEGEAGAAGAAAPEPEPEPEPEPKAEAEAEPEAEPEAGPASRFDPLRKRLANLDAHYKISEKAANLDAQYKISEKAAVASKIAAEKGAVARAPTYLTQALQFPLSHTLPAVSSRVSLPSRLQFAYFTNPQSVPRPSPRPRLRPPLTTTAKASHRCRLT